MDPLLQTLRRSAQLSSFSFITATSFHKITLQHQACLLANLPPCLKRLNVESDWRCEGKALVGTQEQRTEALNLFQELKKGSCFENLTTLSIAGVSVDMKLVVALLQRSPKLEELRLLGRRSKWMDSELAELISNASWKTLCFKEISGQIGGFTVAAILRNCSTLENIRLAGWLAFDSKSIQKLLCSASNLKRLDIAPSHVYGELEPFSLMAMDIVESIEDSVCLGLETFKCYIGGVPRPDITSKNNGRPLIGIYNIGCQYSMLESSTMQRRVLVQLGRLTKLQEIALGKDIVKYEADAHLSHYAERQNELDYYSSSQYELGFQYQCLTMSLQDGLDELNNLKCLRRLTLEKMSLGMGEAEQRWMKENWPEYGVESRDTFWASRGHSVPVGSDPFKEKFNFDSEARDALQTYDWW